MTEAGIIGRVTSVQSTTMKVALDVRARGFTKAGPDGLHTVGIVNSYITVPAGAHRVVAIVSGVSINQHIDTHDGRTLRTEDDQSRYELEASIVGRFEGNIFKSGLTGYPPLHAHVRSASPAEVKSIFLPKDVPSIQLGTAAVDSEQGVFLDANLLLGHHCAVVGSTGSGKSCTVTALIDSLLDHSIPSGHIVIFDINGEYAQSFAQGTARGEATRTIVLGPSLCPDEGLFLPHWFMNNEENLAFFKASEGVQAPVLQRAISDARVGPSSAQHQVLSRLEIVQSVIVAIDQLFNDKNAQQPIREQLVSMLRFLEDQIREKSSCIEQWKKMRSLTERAIEETELINEKWFRLEATQKAILSDLSSDLKKEVTEALKVLRMGSSQGTFDFDAPVYYSLQQLCDQFLPTRIKMEQASDNKVAAYMATLQMRLSRLLADGRYDFMTRVESHEDPLGSYLRLLMGADPTKGDQASDWPSSKLYTSQATNHTDGPSVTIFDLSMVASDVLEDVTALLGRILFDFAVRSDPRAEHPVLLVLEEAHRFVPARTADFGGSGRSTAVFERIAKEGRKFGISLLLASQRPSELSETVVAQCGTVIAHRLTHEADQNLLRHATAFSSRTLLDQLPGLAQQYALVTGVSTGVPVAVHIREVPDAPRSSDPDFLAAWSDKTRLKSLPRHIDRVSQLWSGNSNEPQG
ncbi:DUF87 domain-containing protein [Corynebacterium pseudodiphtheriticum]|uniref:ATP-binding protein n=1 Tax=Corynebacterium pseudodiphtheriticum TaxID=37637 RepID=UPI0025505BF8|nr:DUF87 domain-containing protein [Corynebacterium pseudodiphtheriticum]MDK8613444.1 DUF87 domain-containing protein [Corynebacterium pseudodiphtheriticum]MDK8737378.1 DUF87 domain-containing protein [Corynebacterium pseudodiphtheriticum]MDK8744129.1 DUF87 domain-containing protein [Corynebacterium pseudodiphtheriticum]